jgi:peptide/nickel transport system substrate-binding protein
MTRLDRLFVVVALVAMASVGATIAGSSPVPSAASAPTPSPSPTRVARPERPRLVREGLVGRIATLDPLYATDPAERDVSALLSCGLTRLGPGDSLVPDLATDWDINDAGATYTFHLRHDIRWHDGQPVTADDVAFTILAIQDAGYDGPLRGRWDGVLPEVLDRWTIQFRLGLPLASFLQLSTQPLVPAHLLARVPIGDRRAHTPPTRTVGCGPYRIGTVRTGGFDIVRADGRPPGSTATPVPSAWDPLGPLPEPTPSRVDPDRPVLDGFRFTLFPDAASLEREFAAGRLDTASGLGGAAVARLDGQPGITVVRYPTPTLTALLPNLRFDRTTFQDPEVRRALLLAIHRDSAVGDAFAGSATVPVGLVPPSSSLFDPAAGRGTPYDPDLAAATLSSAGWTPGPAGWVEPGFDTPQPIHLLTVDDVLHPELRALADRVAASWEAIGLRVIVEAVPAGELVQQRLRPGAFDVALLQLDLGLDPDLFPLLASSQAQSGGTNISGYQSAETDRLLSAARRWSDPQTRRARFADLQSRLAGELPILPLAFTDRLYVMRDTVRGPAARLVEDASDRYWNVRSWWLADATGG